ncbi:hypothetical protein PilKf_02101 [Pillotina sp. SPG140]|jgi:fucose 4-O-acetylase-like acetyltransferase
MVSDSILNPLTKQRIEYIDLLKCFAIFCVLWGHVGHKRAEWPPSILFHMKTINFAYSFHMPIFFVISGFLFSSLLSLSFKDFFRKRFTALLIPHITWGIIFALSKLVMTFIDQSRTFNIADEIRIFFIPNPRTDLWFMRELFVTGALVFLSYKIFKKSVPAFITTMLFVMFFDIFGVIGRMQRFMMPVFWTGILLRSFHNSFSKHINKIIIVSGLIFIVCLPFFSSRYTIYGNDFPALINFQQSFIEGNIVFNFTNIGKSGFRLLIGLAGSIFFFALFQRFWKKNTVTSFLSRCGQLTLGIYILQTTILQNWLDKLINPSSLKVGLLVILPLGLCLAAFTFFVSVLIISLIQRNKLLGFILFGSSLVDKGFTHCENQLKTLVPKPIA